MKQHDIAVLVGSVREGSLNRRLAKALVNVAPGNLRLQWIGLEKLPFYNQDLEPDRPEDVVRFTEAVAACVGVIAVTPEYNRSIPAILKNAIDWGSKPLDRNVWANKPAALAGTSPGAIGTAVGQQHLRQILGVLGSVVMGGECYIRFQDEGFISPGGELADPSTKAFLTTYMQRFGDLVDRLAG